MNSNSNNWDMIMYFLYAITLILIFYLLLKYLDKFSKSCSSHEGFDDTSMDNLINAVDTNIDYTDHMLNGDFNHQQVEPQRTALDAKEVVDDMVSQLTENENENANEIAQKMMREQLDRFTSYDYVPYDKFDVKKNTNAVPADVEGYDVKRVYHKNEEVNLPSKKDVNGASLIDKKQICGIADGDNALGCIACKVDYSTPENLVNQNETNTNIMEVCKYGTHKGKLLPSREQCMMTCSARRDKFH
jgi:hypothetical protein